MKTYNVWMGRCRVLLQQPNERHVADIAMLYPINAMQGTYFKDSTVAATHQGGTMPRSIISGVRQFFHKRYATIFPGFTPIF